MSKPITEKYESTICSKCHKEFKIVHIKYACNMEDSRESYYVCPYCGKEYRAYVHGNEDIDSKK